MTAIFVTRRPSGPDGVYSERIQQKLKSELTFLETLHSKDALTTRKEELRTVDFIFSTWGMIPFTKEEITEYFPSLRAVFYAAGTVQYFAKPFLELGIPVHSAWRANGVPVSEVTVAQIVLANKGFFRRRVRSRDAWTSNDPDYIFPGNYGTRIGLLGAGMIGARVIELLRSYHFELLVFDPFLPDERALEMGVKKAEMEEIFSTCHVISNHLANLPETKGIITRELLSKMAENAVFINTGRAAQVDMDALIDEMREHPSRLALLDVTDPVEPPVEDSPLYQLDNIFLTPHIAGSIGYETHRMADYMYEEYRATVEGRETLHGVTLKMLETMA